MELRMTAILIKHAWRNDHDKIIAIEQIAQLTGSSLEEVIEVMKKLDVNDEVVVALREDIEHFEIFSAIETLFNAGYSITPPRPPQLYIVDY